jgi:cellulose synthase (UDP-forming)
MNSNSNPGHSEKSPSRQDRYRDEELSAKATRNFIALLLTALSAAAYLGWAILHLNASYWYILIPWLLAELIAFGNLLLTGAMMLRRREHPPQGLPLPTAPERVDVIVTCCGEPLQIVEQTLRAIAAIDYPNYRAVVADDRNNPGVKALCDELGFQYLSRPTHEHRKAGNLNHALAHTSAPFLLVLDADQIPHHSILNVTMGYFTVPKIGFVTTYQAFRDLAPGDPWGNRDRVFYGAMQTARNASNSSISCGSGVVYRRAAIDEIGGFATWNLVEDLYSSLSMHAKGWKSVYHPFPVSHGTAPADVCGHVKQRWQWAVDSLRLLIWRCPLFTRGLTWKQRLNYVSFGYHYLLFGLAFPIFLLLPAWGLFTNQFFLITTPLQFVLWRAPYTILFYIFNRFTTEHLHRLRSFFGQVGLFAAFFNAFLVALRSRRRLPHYSVTSKTNDKPSFGERLVHVIPHLSIILLNLSAISYGFLHEESRSALYWVNLVWAAWGVWILSPFVRKALLPGSNNTKVR